MGWVNPSTWVDASQVTKGQFADWNNSVAAAGDHTAWSTYDPNLLSVNKWASGGYRRGKKMRVGDVAVVSFDILMGTTAEAYNVEPFRLPLPWNAAVGSGEVACGWAYLYLPGLDNTYTLVPTIAATSQARFRITAAGSSLDTPWWRPEGTFRVGVPPSESSDYASARAAGILVYRVA